MSLNPKLNDAYIAILNYSGLTALDDGSIAILTNPKETVKTEGGKIYHLPYSRHLKRPEGKAIFHILHENYERPEAEAFETFKYNLLIEINTKLAILMATLITIASNPSEHKNVKSGALLELISEVGSIDPKSSIEPEMADILMDKMLPKAIEDRGMGSFVDFFIRKKGVVDGEDFKVIGKTSFIIYNELKKALADRAYKPYGMTLRKKDVTAFLGTFKAIFPNVDEPDAYNTGTDNVVFGFLNALLTTSYTVSHRINHIVDLLIHDLGDSEALQSIYMDLKWVDHMEELYGLTTEIRMIPNQDDVRADANRSGKLKFNESQVLQQATPDLRNQVQKLPQPTYAPQEPVQQQQQQYVPQQQQVQVPQQQVQQPQQQQPSIEQLVASGQYGAMMQPQQQMTQYNNPFQQQQQQMMFQQQQMQQPQQPSWMNQPKYWNNGQGMTPQQQQYLAQQQQLQQMQQGMMQQNLMYNQQYQQPQQMLQPSVFDMPNSNPFG